MILAERRYLNPFSPHGAAALDVANTQHLKSTHPSVDRFRYTDHKNLSQVPTSRYISTNPSTYLL